MPRPVRPIDYWEYDVLEVQTYVISPIALDCSCWVDCSRHSRMLPTYPNSHQYMVKHCYCLTTTNSYPLLLNHYCASTYYYYYYYCCCCWLICRHTFRDPIIKIKHNFTNIYVYLFMNNIFVSPLNTPSL